MIRNKYLLYSSVIHILLFLITGLTFHFHQQLKNSPTPYINTYTYSSLQSTLKPVKSPTQHSLQKKLSYQNFKNSHSIKQIENHPSNSNKETLLTILHEAIAEKQEYPEGAIELHHSGSVKISFFLSPNGKLSQIKLINSSGYDDIDYSAITAVQAIDYIKDVNVYINKEELFEVDVVYVIN